MTADSAELLIQLPKHPLNQIILVSDFSLILIYDPKGTYIPDIVPMVYYSTLVCNHVYRIGIF